MRGRLGSASMRQMTPLLVALLVVAAFALTVWQGWYWRQQAKKRGEEPGGASLGGRILLAAIGALLIVGNIILNRQTTLLDPPGTRMAYTVFALVILLGVALAMRKRRQRR